MMSTGGARRTRAAAQSMLSVARRERRARRSGSKRLLESPPHRTSTVAWSGADMLPDLRNPQARVQLLECEASVRDRFDFENLMDGCL
jgi:hypothetical protein